MVVYLLKYYLVYLYSALKLKIKNRDLERFGKKNMDKYAPVS